MNEAKPIDWRSAGQFEDILYHKAEGIAKLTINRPEVRNAINAQGVLSSPVFRAPNNTTKSTAPRPPITVARAFSSFTGRVGPLRMRTDSS